MAIASASLTAVASEREKPLARVNAATGSETNSVNATANSLTTAGERGKQPVPVRATSLRAPRTHMIGRTDLKPECRADLNVVDPAATTAAVK